MNTASKTLLDSADVAAELGIDPVDVLRLVAQRRLAGHTAPIQVLAFADGGRRLVSAGNDARILVWDVAPGGAAAGASWYLNLLWAKVRKVRPSGSPWAMVVVASCTRVFSATRVSLVRSVASG